MREWKRMLFLSTELKRFERGLYRWRILSILTIARSQSATVFLVFTWRHQNSKIKTGRPTEILPSFKERLPKNIFLHNSLARLSCILLKIEEFQFSNFHRAWHRRTAVAELFRIFKMTLTAIFSILNNVSIRRNICLNFRMFTTENKPLFWQKWTTDVFSHFRPPCWCPCTWAPTWRPILISINLCETLCQITRVWNTAQTWGLDRVLIYISSIACKFLDFIHWMVFDFYFDGVTVKTGNCRCMKGDWKLFVGFVGVKSADLKDELVDLSIIERVKHASACEDSLLAEVSDSEKRERPLVSSHAVVR